MLENGKKKMMKDLRIGDKIWTVENGFPVTTNVLGFLEKSRQYIGEYIRISFGNEQKLTISASHVMFVVGEDNGVSDVFAKDVKIGDMVYVLQNRMTKVVEVVDLERVQSSGAYVPLTFTGTLIVDGVLVSSYANIGHWKAHTLFTPLRWFPTLLLDTEQTQDMEGIRTIPGIAKRIGNSVGLITTTKNVQEEYRRDVIENMGRVVSERETICMI